MTTSKLPISRAEPKLPTKVAPSYKQLIQNLCHLHTADVDSFSESRFYTTDFSKISWLNKAAERFPKKSLLDIANDCIGYRNSFAFQKNKKLYN